MNESIYKDSCNSKWLERCFQDDRKRCSCKATGVKVGLSRRLPLDVCFSPRRRRKLSAPDWRGAPRGVEAPVFRVRIAASYFRGFSPSESASHRFRAGTAPLDRLDVGATRVFRSLRIVYRREAVNAMLYGGSPGVAVRPPSAGIIQVPASAGSFSTYTNRIHPSSPTVLPLHSLFPFSSPSLSFSLSHRVCSVVWGSCSGATL